ncbi:MAG TPA: VCBS repeat-containing protein [Verrucomicrobiae bacterium]|nr:VCBS repeat-containing protein [Verrucomicrobiae bacterium]
MVRIANRFALFPQFVLVCLLLFGIGRSSVASAGQQSAAVPHSGLNGPRFLFADFDGDRIPDLAQVESQNQRSARNNYRIHVKLSAGVESAIGVSGPDGGLRVAARDVNGDEALDLIVTSNLDASFVEVLLNDGHGNFTVAEGNEFARLEAKFGDIGLKSPNAAPADRVSLAGARYSSDLGAAEHGHRTPLILSRGYSKTAAQVVLRRPVGRYGSRSPPASIASS